jgi:hypothetical protein
LSTHLERINRDGKEWLLTNARVRKHGESPNLAMDSLSDGEPGLDESREVVSAHASERVAEESANSGFSMRLWDRK